MKLLEQATVETVTSVIGTLGFPIFVAVWMLMKGSKDSQELKQAVNEMTTAVKILSEKIDDK